MDAQHRAGMADTPAASPTCGATAALVLGKRHSRDDDAATESEEEKMTPEELTEITDEDVLAALTNLKGKQFNVQTRVMDVADVVQWHKTNTARHTKLVFDDYYQRDQSKGWSDEQKSQYLSSVFGGRASTPFVVNTLRARARLMDGGHRLHAIIAFLQNKTPMMVEGTKVYYKQLSQDDQDHFQTRNLQVMQFFDLPLKDEITYYNQLNSGLVFSFGERLHATRHINPVTNHADTIRMMDGMDVVVKEFCAIVNKTWKGVEEGRKNELLVMTYLMHQLFFCRRDESMITSMAETFLEAVFKFNQDTKKQMEECLNLYIKDVDVVGHLQVVLSLYQAMEAETKGRDNAGTRLRRLHMCILAVVDIADLDVALFARFYAAVTADPPPCTKFGRRLRRLLTTQCSLKSSDIAVVVQSYKTFAMARDTPPPPPPPPASQPHTLSH